MSLGSALAELDPETRPESFRLYSRTIAATWPRCDVPKQDVLENIQGLFGPNLNIAIVCSETHSDGGLHLHAAIHLHKAHDFRTYRKLDRLTGQHGNYMAAKHFGQWLKYCLKHDRDPAAIGLDCSQYLIDHALLSSKRTKSNGHFIQVMQTIVATGGCQETVRREHPDTWLRFRTTLLNECQDERARVRAAKRVSWPSELPPFPTGATLAYRQIRHWLQNNILKPRFDKQKQLWIKGPTNCGKTSLRKQLQKYLRTYEIVAGTQYWDGYSDSVDLIYAEEYKGCLPLTVLNAVAEGASTSVIQKYKPPYEKSKNIPMIIFSNYTPEEAYFKALTEGRSDITPTLERFVVVVVPLDDYRNTPGTWIGNITEWDPTPPPPIDPGIYQDDEATPEQEQASPPPRTPTPRPLRRANAFRDQSPYEYGVV